MTTLSASPRALGPRGLQVVSRSIVGNLTSLCELNGEIPFTEYFTPLWQGFRFTKCLQMVRCMYVKPRLMVVVGGAFLSPRRAVGNGKVKRTIAPSPPDLSRIEAKPCPSKSIFAPSDFQTFLRPYPVMG